MVSFHSLWDTDKIVFLHHEDMLLWPNMLLSSRKSSHAPSIHPDGKLHPIFAVLYVVYASKQQLPTWKKNVKSTFILEMCVSLK